MADKVKIQENSVQETLMLPLYGRAYCAKEYPNTLPDPTSIDVFSQVDFDVSRLEFKKVVAIVWSVRARVFADKAREYLKDHPKATIVNLGCGLDTSFANVDNGQCRWVNLDLPDVIEAREQLVPCKDREMNIACSAFDTKWIDEVGANPADGVFIMSAGVFFYFHEEEVRDLVCTLAQAYPGGRIIFDAENARGVKMSNRTVQGNGNNGAMMYFAVDDAAKQIAPWSSRFAQVRTYNRLPDDIGKSKELPLLIRMYFSLALKMGIMKFIEIDFAK